MPLRIGREDGYEIVSALLDVYPRLLEAIRPELPLRPMDAGG
jgi:hypothetical protein